uniref:Uncharacterized protein n=1 Tax=Leersia perrieri TaxID=77586 RepID=A0A0D9VGH9_9ORYZ
MKRDQQQVIAKLPTSGARNLLLFMFTKKAMLAAVAAKCRELWQLLLKAGSACGLPHCSSSAAADDGYYFGRSYEFSCSATPVAFFPAKGRRSYLPPCVGGKQAMEMMTMSPGRPVGGEECSTPERSPQCWREQEINGLAEDFINRFYAQLRLQERPRQQLECRASPSLSP